jgi:hypothetical protein
MGDHVGQSSSALSRPRGVRSGIAGLPPPPYRRGLTQVRRRLEQQRAHRGTPRRKPHFFHFQLLPPPAKLMPPCGSLGSSRGVEQGGRKRSASTTVSTLATSSGRYSGPSDDRSVRRRWPWRTRSICALKLTVAPECSRSPSARQTAAHPVKPIASASAATSPTSAAAGKGNGQVVYINQGPERRGPAPVNCCGIGGRPRPSRPAHPRRGQEFAGPTLGRRTLRVQPARELINTSGG